MSDLSSLLLNQRKKEENPRLPLSILPNRRSCRSRCHTSQCRGARSGNATVWSGILLKTDTGTVNLPWTQPPHLHTHKNRRGAFTWEADERFGPELVQAQRLHQLRHGLPLSTAGRLGRGVPLKELPQYWDGHPTCSTTTDIRQKNEKWTRVCVCVCAFTGPHRWFYWGKLWPPGASTGRETGFPVLGCRGSEEGSTSWTPSF